MKNLITYLKALWSWVADSQSTDVSLDCRLTVGSPSFHRRSTMLKLVSVLVLILTVGVGNVWGAEGDIAYTLDFTAKTASNNSYTNTWTYGDFSLYAGSNNSKSWAYVRFGGKGGSKTSSTKTINSTITSTTVIASTKTIKQITIEHTKVTSGNYTANKCTLQVASNSDFSSIIDTRIIDNPVKNGTSFNFTPNEVTVWPASSYYKITIGATIKGTSNIGVEIAKVKFVEGASGGGCDNQVNITNSSTTSVSHGSFDVDKTGSQDACSALSVTITPDPDEHYHVASVSATDPATTGTAGAAVDNGDGTWTITYSANSKGASTVNVTFAADDHASVTLSEAGATTTDATTYYPGDSYTLPVSTSASCGTKTLVGWSTVTVAETNTKPASNFYAPGAVVTLGASQTYYAVFAQASTTSFAEITDASDLVTGDYVVAYYYSSTQIAMGNTNNGSDKINASNIALTNSKYDSPAAAYVWHLERQANGSIKFYNANASKYLNATNSALQMANSGTEFNVTYSSGWLINFASDARRVHGYISGSTYDFRQSTSSYKVKLYRNELSAYTTLCSCPSYSFHDGTHDVSDWQISCFEYSGNSDRQWIKNFTVRNKPKYYVGKQGNFYNDNLGNNNAKSYENDMQYMQLALDRGHNSNNQLGSNYAGVQGTVLCYDNSSSDNLYVDFLPDGYYFLLDAANTPTALPMTCTDADMTAANILSHNTVWETEIQTVTSVSYKYSVGIKADAAIAGQAWQKTRYNTNEDMTSLQKRNASSSFTGSLAAADVSAKARGKYRIWANNFSTTAGQKNWYAHFVPYIGVTYYDADNSSVISQTSDANAVSIEAAAGDKEFTISATAPTKANYTFVGWNTLANQTTATYTNGQTDVALSAWTYLYPAFTENPKANVIVNPSSNGSVVADHTTNVYQGTTVTLTITPSSGYQLSSISAVDGSSNPVSLTGTGNSRTFTMPASNVTVTATFVVRTDYVLVTNVSELNDGDVITIANMKGNNAEGKILHSQADNNRNTKAVTTAADGKIADSDVEYPITLVSDASGWKLYDQENAGYLYAVKGSNYLKNSATPTPTYNDVWTIEIVQTAGDYQYQARIHQTPCNGGGCGQESRSGNNYDRYIEFNSAILSTYLYNYTDGYIYKKELGCDKLAAPTGLTASSITQTTVTLSWNSVSNASGYEISLNNGSSWTSTSTNTSYNATGLTAGTTYNWKVRATGTGDYCAAGNAASSTVTMKNAVKVTYKTNGATGGQLPVAGGVVNLTEGDSHTILGNTGSGGSPTPLTKTGYVFDGWHSSSTYSSTPAYTIGSSITVNSNVDIYANWKPKKDTFVDAVHNTATQYGEGANYTIPSCDNQTRYTSGTCEETHYKFIGWALAGADLTNPSNIIHAGDTQTASGTDASPKTYYAVWAEEL